MKNAAAAAVVDGRAGGIHVDSVLDRDCLSMSRRCWLLADENMQKRGKRKM